MFGGSQLETLYVTTIGENLNGDAGQEQPLAGALLAIEGHGTHGLPQTRFAG